MKTLFLLLAVSVLIVSGCSTDRNGDNHNNSNNTSYHPADANDGNAKNIPKGSTVNGNP